MANQYPSNDQTSGTVLERICSHWQHFAFKRIKQLDHLVIVTQEYQDKARNVPYTGEEWQQGLEGTLNQIKGPRTKFVVLGNIPTFRISSPGLPGRAPRCRAAVLGTNFPGHADLRSGRTTGGHGKGGALHLGPPLDLYEEEVQPGHRPVRGLPESTAHHRVVLTLLGTGPGRRSFSSPSTDPPARSLER